MKKTLLKLISFFLLFPIISGGTASFAATDIWDGYVQSGSETVYERSLFDFNSTGGFIPLGLPPCTDNTLYGNKYSIRCNEQVTNPDIYIYMNGDLMDWSEYTILDFEIYSEKATNADFMVLVMCPPSALGPSYFYKKLTISWTGWKHFQFNLEELDVSRSPSLENVTSVRFCFGVGWNLVANPESDLYISSLKIIKKDEFNFVNNFYSKDKINAYSQALNEGAAVYAGGSNVALSAGSEKSGYTFGYKNECVTVPLDFFKTYFGADVKTSADEYTISLGEKLLNGKIGSANVTSGDAEELLPVQAYSENGLIYVPGAKIASLLGLETVTDGKLLAIGKTDSIKALERTENLGVNESGEIASYNSYHNEYNAANYSADDCTNAKKNWLLSIVGSPEVNDMENADIAARVNSITNSAVSARKFLVRDSASGELFSDMDSKESADITTAYERVQSMAYAYGCSGSPLYMDKDLGDDIKYSLDWLKENRYNEDSYSRSANADWIPTGFNNWWDWDIGVPAKLVNILMVTEGMFNSKQIDEYLAFYNRRVPIPRMTGANYTDMAFGVIGSALLKNDVEKVVRVQTLLTKTFLYADDNDRFAESLLDARRASYTDIKGAGFFTDGSYILHTLHPHLGSYGLVQMNTFSKILSLFANTNLSMNIPFTDNVMQIYENSFKPVIYDNKLFRWTMGRGPERNAAEVQPVCNMFVMSDYFDDDAKSRIYSDIKSAALGNYSLVKAKLPLSHLKKLEEIMNDESVKSSEEKNLNKVYYNSDKVIHKRDRWSMAVSMSSARIFNYESINNQNTNGWYLSDGRTEYYLRGNDINSTEAYYSAVDKYRMPGTTVDTQERKRASVNQGNEYLSSKKFVGGVSLGDFGAAAMELESYHNDTDFGTSGPNPAHKSDLTAKKAYFMFDDETVCLGSAVNAKDNNDAEVLTVVENKLSKNTVSLSDVTEQPPYEIVSAEANQTPEPENTAENTIDDSYTTKYAGYTGAEVIWDLGEVKNLGFIDLSFIKGSSRKQYFNLEVSSDKLNWTEVFSGESSGKSETNEYFTLGNSDARYVKFINLGNSGGTAWVSLSNCAIYPPNADGSVGRKPQDIFGSDNIIADGERLNIYGDDVDLSAKTWINAADECGYVFPKNAAENSGVLKARWTRGTNSCFEMWFSHGVNPTNGGYAYILLPGMTAEQTKAYAEKENINVLINNENIQAVKDVSTGITGIVFWSEGTFGGITVDKPCMLMVRESDGAYEIAVSDPTQKLESLSVTADRALTCVSSDEMASSETENGKTTITYNMKGSVGRSMKCSFVPEGKSAS